MSKGGRRKACRPRFWADYGKGPLGNRYQYGGTARSGTRMNMIAEDVLKRFVVLSSARSGSNMLVTMLDEHPEARCYGEAFNPDYGRGYEKWRNRSWTRRAIGKYLQGYSMESYLDSLFARVDGTKVRAAGFKVIYPGQFDRAPVLRYYWRTRGFKAIALTRKNLLRKYVSAQIANQDQVWSSREARQKTVSVRIDATDLERSLRRMETVNRLILDVAREFRGMEVSYEDLIEDRSIVMGSICRFLGIRMEDAASVKPRTARQNPAHLSELIENYEEVRELLMGTRYEALLEGDAD